MAVAMLGTLAAADGPVSPKRQFNPMTGTVAIGDGLATVKLPPDLAFLGKDDANWMLEQEWENPHDPSVIGLVIGTAPATREVAVVVSWDGKGHVEDSDAAGLDYAALLAQMQEATREGTKGTRHPQELLGWAEQPHYDSAGKKIWWAKSFTVDGKPEPYLNYCVRILGARGVLELNAMGRTKDLPTVAPAAKSILAVTELNPGHRYQDYKPGVDPVQAGGIAALIGGAVLAKKVGFFALIGVLLVKFWKIIAVAVVGIGALIFKLRSRRSA